ncbi:MAG: hypothetical protein JKY93_10355 [Gammaproteobacteria bacterium]|nr:hypothetical protein [Gammaproteobacteria bacterium]
MTESMIMEWLGSITAVMGATWLALNIKTSRYGWFCFLLSNIAWLRYGFMHDMGSMLLMQTGFILTAFLGIYRNFISQPVNKPLFTDKTADGEDE